ncbi:MAG: hypothetical protein V7L20_14515 [Nostoc sp.]|uniref:hypothetical protein n=1 Tax=Nostoc sp. TaxID=1180 RepID=UPI002FF73B83
MNPCQSATINIELPTLVTDTKSPDIPQTFTQVSNPATQGWKGLNLKMQRGIENAGYFYHELISKVGNAIGVADGEPYWNAYLG